MSRGARYVAVRYRGSWAVKHPRVGFDGTSWPVAVFRGPFGRFRANRHAARLNRGQW